MTLNVLTKNQEKLRYMWNNQALFPYEDTDELVEKLETEDGFTVDEILDFIDLIEIELQTGIYKYPPPPITRENQHLHMVETDDSWMYQ